MYYFEKLAGYIDIYVMENYNYIQLDNEIFLWGKQSIKVAERMGKMQENRLADGKDFEFWEKEINYLIPGKNVIAGLKALGPGCKSGDIVFLRKEKRGSIWIIKSWKHY